MTPIKRILVPVDFSSCSRAALQQAALFAKQMDASVEVLHVCEAPQFVAASLMVELPHDSPQTLERYTLSQAENEMEAFLDGQPYADWSRSVVLGDPASMIVDVAKERESDLIIMGTHGRRGLAHLFLGSVAEKIVRHAPCPVLTVPSDPKRRSEMATKTAGEE